MEDAGEAGSGPLSEQKEGIPWLLALPVEVFAVTKITAYGRSAGFHGKEQCLTITRIVKLNRQKRSAPSTAGRLAMRAS